MPLGMLLIKDFNKIQLNFMKSIGKPVLGIFFPIRAILSVHSNRMGGMGVATGETYSICMWKVLYR